MSFYRVSHMNGKWQAVQFEDIGTEVESIDDLATGGTPVIIVSDLEELELLDIDPTTVTVIND